MNLRKSMIFNFVNSLMKGNSNFRFSPYSIPPPMFRDLIGSSNAISQYLQEPTKPLVQSLEPNNKQLHLLQSKTINCQLVNQNATLLPSKQTTYLSTGLLISYPKNGSVHFIPSTVLYKQQICPFKVKTVNSSQGSESVVCVFNDSSSSYFITKHQALGKVIIEEKECSSLEASYSGNLIESMILNEYVPQSYDAFTL